MMKNFDSVIEVVSETKGIFNDRLLKVTEKGKADYVTQVDFEVQDFLERRLKLLHPDVRLISEEKEGAEVRQGEPAWILDPVDGTTNLIHGYRHSAVSLAYHNGSEVERGIIYNPFTGEMFTAKKGEGAFLNGKKIRVTNEDKPEGALISIGTSPYYKELAPANFVIFEKLFRNCQDFRRSGSASLDIAYVACGRTEVFFENLLSPWDFAAGIVILREAGGRISDWQGSELRLTGKTSAVATNGFLHEYMLKILTGTAE